LAGGRSMTVATLPTPTTPTLQPYRWNVKQFHDACDRNIWGDGKRMILIRGELFEVPPMNSLHAACLVLVHAILLKIVPTNCEVRQQSPLILSLDTDPVPDFMIVPGSWRDYLVHNPTTALLAIEIAFTSLDFDLTTKAELFASANVPEYWVLDIPSRRLFVLREPTPLPTNGGQHYRSQVELTDKDTVAPLFDPDKAIRIADLLP
jgi:Uma2 family endonuclease